MWDYFEYVIPLMQDRYHLIIPALPGYDEDAPGDFTSVEEIAGELADWLIEDTKLNLAFEVSMGKGSGYSREHFQQIISEYYTPEEVEYCMKIWDMDIWA